MPFADAHLIVFRGPFHLRPHSRTMGFDDHGQEMHQHSLHLAWWFTGERADRFDAHHPAAPVCVEAPCPCCAKDSSGGDVCKCCCVLMLRRPKS